MEPGERTTGTRDEHYGLVRVLYHALHGADNCSLYAMDAEAAGREDLTSFFREARERQTELAERTKGLLGIGADTMRVGDTPLTEDERRERSPLPEAGIAPPGEVPPDAPRMGEVPPRTGDAPPSPSKHPAEESSSGS